MERMDRDALVERLRAAVRQHADGVTAAYLFGSAARGEERADSDVEVALLLPRGARLRLDTLPLALVESIERAAAPARADVAFLNGAGAEFIHRVLRDGILLDETGHAARVECEVQARNECFGILPMLRRHRRSLIRRA